MLSSKIMIQQRFNDFWVVLGLLQEGQHLTSRKPIGLHQLPKVIGSIRVDSQDRNDTQLGITRQDVVPVTSPDSSHRKCLGPLQ